MIESGKVDSAVRLIRFALARLARNQSPHGRRAARADVRAEVRKLFALVDRLYPPPPRKEKKRKRRKLGEWDERDTVPTAVAAKIQAAGIKVYLDPALEDAWVPVWAAQLARNNVPTKDIKKARRDVGHRRALLAEIALAKEPATRRTP